MIIIARLNIADVRETLMLPTLRLMTDICSRMNGRNHQVYTFAVSKSKYAKQRNCKSLFFILCIIK